MRKWNCHFDGKNLYSFLERVTELKVGYGLTDAQLLQGFPELLRGNAQLWHRNITDSINTWDELQNLMKEFFLSPNELRQLDRQIFERKQLPRESALEYSTALCTLMRRRGNIDLQTQLDNLYENMRPDLQLHVSRESISSVSDLVRKVEIVQEKLAKIAKEKPINNSDNRFVQNRHKNNVMSVTAPYVREECCWRCKNRGHNRFQCQNRPRKFCSYCGKDGTFAKDCTCPRSGNAVAAGPAQARPRAD